MDYKICPICNKKKKMMLRYPKIVCSQCISTGIWSDKQKTNSIKFQNIGFNGGFMSIVNNIKGNQHLCYINGKQCRADESRFGGIVIQYND